LAACESERKKSWDASEIDFFGGTRPVSDMAGMA